MINSASIMLRNLEEKTDPINEETVDGARDTHQSTESYRDGDVAEAHQFLPL